MRLYLDGAQLTNKTTSLPAQMDPDTESTTWIGRTGVNAGYLDGKITDVKIFMFFIFIRFIVNTLIFLSI